MTTDRNLSRRTFVSGTAASAAAAAVAVKSVGAEDHSGHGNPSFVPSAAQDAANIPTPREQTVVISQSTNQVWDSFNPYIPNGEAYQYGVNQLCREAMFYVNFPKGEIINQLASGYTYNADFTEFTLHLTPEANWSDGQPFSADDVVFSI